MAKGSLRRFDVQAKISLYVSGAAALCMVALLVLLMRNYRSSMQLIIYKPGGMYSPVIYATTILALLMAGAGAVMGASSAGQKRNTHNKRSWVAFFLGGATISATLILFYAFRTFQMGIAG
ncbi:MAG TPA: hypothetical protein P5572_01645 [Phycisphaerae bacterium]|nr:hypothetical protein [Phycisphaerae bacterium]